MKKFPKECQESGRNIKSFRTIQKISLRELSLRTKISEKKRRGMDAGEVKIDIPALGKIAQAL